MSQFDTMESGANLKFFSYQVISSCFTHQDDLCPDGGTNLPVACGWRELQRWKDLSLASQSRTSLSSWADASHENFWSGLPELQTKKDSEWPSDWIDHVPYCIYIEKKEQI